MGKRELVALLSLSSSCRVTVIVLWLFLAVPWVCHKCEIELFPDHAHLLFSFKLHLGIKTPGVWPVSYSYHNINIRSVDKTQAS